MKKDKKYSLNNLLDIITEGIIIFIKRLNKYLSDKNKKGILKVIIRILSCLMILAILKVPFLAIGYIGKVVISLIFTTFNLSLSIVWLSIVRYSYMLFSLIVLFKLIEGMSKRKDYKIEIKESPKIGDNLYYALKSVLKIIIAVSLIPLVLVLLLLFMITGIIIYLLTHGIYFIGPIIVILGLIIVVITSLSWISDYVFYGKGGNK